MANKDSYFKKLVKLEDKFDAEEQESFLQGTSYVLTLFS